MIISATLKNTELNNVMLRYYKCCQ